MTRKRCERDMAAISTRRKLKSIAYKYLADGWWNDSVYQFSIFQKINFSNFLAGYQLSRMCANCEAII